MEDCILSCEGDDNSSRFEERVSDALEMMDTLEAVCAEVREKISKQLEFGTFSLASQILMFVDPVPDMKINEFHTKIKECEYWL